MGVECKGCSWQLRVNPPCLRIVLFDGQWSGNDPHASFHKSLPTRTRTRTQERNLFPSLEVSGTTTSNYNRSSDGFRKYYLRPIGKCSHHFQVQHKMLLEFFASTIVRGCSVSSQSRGWIVSKYSDLHSKLQPAPANRVHRILAVTSVSLFLEWNQW